MAFPRIVNAPRPWWVTLLGLAIGLSVPGGLAGQVRGELGRFEVDGLDFRPDGAWRRRAAEVRARRQALLQSRDFAALNAPMAQAGLLRAPGGPDAPVMAQAITGSFYVPNILIAYSDVAVAYPRQSFADVLFSPDPAALGRAYTLKTFYEELSNGLIQLDGRVFDVVRVDTTAAYYQDGCNGIGVLVPCPNGFQRLARLLLSTLDSISNRPGADTVWNRFDNDGPDGLPNSGDDDGVVDFVSFLQPTPDGSCGTPGIWAHRWVLSALNAGSPYVTGTPRRNAQGQPIPGQFLVVNDYIIQSQLGGFSGCDPNNIMAMGTVAHETGHAFGLPDLYDTDPSSRTQGIGHWGLMGSGNHARPYSPSSYEAWSLVEVGWVALDELTDSRIVTTGPRQLSDTVFFARTNEEGTHVLIENRQAVHSDTAQMGPGYNPRKMPGLLIWLIDEARIAQGRGANRVNTGSRQGVSLIQADGLNQLRTPGSLNRGDIGDSYPGSTDNSRYTFSSIPAARTNLNAFVGFIVDQIEQLPDQAMRFRFLRRGPSLFTADPPTGRIRVNDVELSRFNDVLPEGEPVALDVPSPQTSPDGRSRATFLSWSNGGPASQTVVSGPIPDTLIASLAAEHRVLVTVLGTGGVSASPNGDVGAGVFFPQGAQITLTAAPPPGVLFTGWAGDTASTNPVLQLSVVRAYDLQAVFVAEIVIDESAATLDLLGTPSLTADERAFLDTFGNQNGSYDVGDYLAYLRRQGIAPSPALLSRLGKLRGSP